MKRFEHISASFSSRLAMLLNLKIAGLMKNQGDIQEGVLKEAVENEGNWGLGKEPALAFKAVHIPVRLLLQVLRVLVQ